MSGLTLFEQLIIILTILLFLDIGIVFMVVHVYKRRWKKTLAVNSRTEKLFYENAVKAAAEEETEIEQIRTEEGKTEDELKTFDIEQTEAELEAIRPIVIRVQNVTMEFNVTTVQVSGIKELLILRLKKRTSFRCFKALDQVSFHVQQGEVIGIIGTNGSGKSTMLKLISGALIPTSGWVKVDRRKVQLLTLGTGFDMELTARENIYLNGAIIGYTKEYIDLHFDEIIQFAELGDFIDEKLKNYSSGMVSRLGFAIATSGKAAEILILDEVLSVGDIYFREKSMRRIQEMIHSGSTVIMVSHSVDTICRNCTRAIWIEQGRLLADGKPDEVCRLYEDMQRIRKEELITKRKEMQ